jgi:hypothetical protein
MDHMETAMQANHPLESLAIAIGLAYCAAVLIYAVVNAMWVFA